MAFTLDKIVREFMLGELGLESIDRRYSRFLSLGISALRDLYYDSVGNVPNEVVLDVNDNGTVDLPSDFIDYYALGILSDGELVSLGFNGNLTDISKDDCGVRIEPSNDAEGTDALFSFENGGSFNDKGENQGGYYGVGGGKSSIGEFKIYKDKGYIALNGYTGTQIILRYKADINMVDGDFNVHPYNVQPIKDYIWKHYIGKAKGYNLGQIQLANAAYKESKKKAQKQHLSMNAREIVSAFKSGYRSSPGI